MILVALIVIVVVIVADPRMLVVTGAAYLCPFSRGNSSNGYSELAAGTQAYTPPLS
jgi:hypothetical protein